MMIRRAAWIFWTPWVALGAVIYWLGRDRWAWIGGPWLSPLTFGFPWILFGLILWFPLYFLLNEKRRD
jgi:hypothetical protein